MALTAPYPVENVMEMQHAIRLLESVQEDAKTDGSHHYVMQVGGKTRDKISQMWHKIPSKNE